MGRAGISFLDELFGLRATRMWSKAVRRAETMPISAVRRRLGQAELLSTRVAEFRRIAEDRLALPRIGADALRRADGADWAWRPEAFRYRAKVPGVAAAASGAAIDEAIRLFHDCDRSELTLRQTRNGREEDLSPFGLELDVFAFDGSFLSLAVDLPAEAAQNLRRDHIVRVDLDCALERPLEVFLRLNIRHGPNTEQVVRELPRGRAEASTVEFDLAYTRLNERRSERMWLDIIFERPQMNRIWLRDLTFARRLRAEI